MQLQPMVQKRKGETRRGKGFSRNELREAGTNSKQARKLGIPVDPRRKTKHDENVKFLKNYLSSLGLKKAPKSRKVK